MMQLLMIFIGGGLGALTRFGMTKWLQGAHAFLSVGTIASNILSCLILGFFIGYAARFPVDKAVHSFLLIGFCGGFSTFSTFSYENYKLLLDGHYGSLVFNVLVSVFICFLAIILGLRLVKMLY